MARARGVLLAAAISAVGAVAILAALGPVRSADVGDAEADRSKRFDPVPMRARALRRKGRYLTAWLQRPARLYNRPGGRVVARLEERTEWGTPRVLSVVKVRRHATWLGVLTEHRPNGRLGWIRTGATKPAGVDEALVIDLSARKLTFLRKGRRVLRFRVAIGRPANPTPTGRFAVTDILRVRDVSPYGCCAIALSGRQPRVPVTWTGGDRLAIHGTANRRSIGRAISLGCPRGMDAQMRRLFRERPQPGTPVFIRR
jgi:hypothetical protein